MTAADLAELLSVAVRIEPHLIRAVRTRVAPHLDAGCEADLWFGDLVGTRSPTAVALRPEVMPRMRAGLAERLRRADPGDPVYRIGEVIAEAHTGLPPALALEERVAWLAVIGAAEDELDRALRPALRALAEDGRTAIADWFCGAWNRMPAAARATRSAWQLAQVAAQRVGASAARTPPGVPELAQAPAPDGLAVEDVAVISGVLPDVPLGLHRDRDTLILGADVGEASTAVLVPDTRPRVVEVRWGNGESRTTALLSSGDRLNLRVGDGEVLLATARGDVYRLPAWQRSGSPGPEQGQPDVWNGPPRNRGFVGREQDIEQVRAALAQHGRAALVPVSLHGLGGVGKTQVAVEYLHRYAGEYDLVWWLSAEQLASVRAGLAELGERLSLPYGHGATEQVRTTLAALAEGRPYERWLLVYDNAHDPAELTDYIPPNGHVLIVSRDPTWAGTTAAVEIDLFDRYVSVELLRRRLPDLSAEHADRIADGLGDLPLALEQAAAWLSATAMPAAEYLELLETRTIELLDEARPPTYPTTVVALFGMSMARLLEQDPGAVELLRLIACLGPEQVPLWLLEAVAEADPAPALARATRDPLALRRALGRIARFSLIKVDAGVVRMPKLLRPVIRDEMTPEQHAEMYRLAAAVLAAANPGEPENPATWPRHAVVGSAIQFAVRDPGSRPAMAELIIDQLRYRLAIGDFAGCRSLVEEVRGEAPVRPDDPFQLLVDGCLARAQAALGDIDHAAEVNADVLDRSRRILGEDHPDTLEVAIRVGADLRLRGDHLGARTLDEATLGRLRDLCPPGDRRSIAAARGLAADLRLAGDFRAALALDRVSVETLTRIRGPRHLDTLRTTVELAFDHYGAGAFDEGWRVLEPARSVLTEIYGAGGTELRDADRIAVALRRRQGANAEAADLALRLPDDPPTGGVSAARANAERARGQARSAVVTALAAYTVARDTFGAESVHTLPHLVNLAAAWQADGRHDEARTAARQALALLTGTVGPAHPYTLACAAVLDGDAEADIEIPPW